MKKRSYKWSSDDNVAAWRFGTEYSNRRRMLQLLSPPPHRTRGKVVDLQHVNCGDHLAPPVKTVDAVSNFEEQNLDP